MISVIVPTLNAEQCLATTLTALVTPVVEGVVREVIVADGGSTDRTLKIAEQSGATIVRSECGRGHQLRSGAGRARGSWLLFLHADTILEPGWSRDAVEFMRRVEGGRYRQRAGVFRFRLDDDGFAPRCLEALVAVRLALFKFPYGDQGMLISRSLYDKIGGYRALALMEDVDFVRRLGRRRVQVLRATATTSAERYRETGYLRRIARNQMCLALYFLRVPPAKLVRFYAPAGTPNVRGT